MSKTRASPGFGGLVVALHAVGQVARYDHAQAGSGSQHLECLDKALDEVEIGDLHDFAFLALVKHGAVGVHALVADVHIVAGHEAVALASPQHLVGNAAGGLGVAGIPYLPGNVVLPLDEVGLAQLGFLFHHLLGGLPEVELYLAREPLQLVLRHGLLGDKGLAELLQEQGLVETYAVLVFPLHELAVHLDGLAHAQHVALVVVERVAQQYLGKALEIGGPVELEAAWRDLLDEHLALAGALLAHQCAHRVVEGLLLVAPFVVVVATGHGKEQAQDQDENDV